VLPDPEQREEVKVNAARREADELSLRRNSTCPARRRFVPLRFTQSKISGYAMAPVDLSVNSNYGH